MVFAHHPMDDPAETDASQLGDRNEVALIEKMLTDFRAHSNKGVAMVGSHAQIADVHRDRGRAVHGAAVLGQGPVRHAGSRRLHRLAATGRSTKDASAAQQWLTADVRAFAQSITLDAPDVARGGRQRAARAARSCSRRASPTARASCRCATRCRSTAAARTTSPSAPTSRPPRRAGKAAILDPLTRKLTGLRTGDVTVRVTNDSMREYTDEASLAPITTEKTIHVQVTHVGSEPGRRAGPGDAGADGRRGGRLRRVRAGRDEGLHGVHHRQRHLDGGRRGADGLRPAHARQRHVQAGAAGRRSRPEKTAWTGPVANDAFAIAFKQSIDATDPLRTGNYSAAVTFTLATIATEDRGTIGFGYDSTISCPTRATGARLPEWAGRRSRAVARGRAFRALLSELAKR